MTTHTYAEQSLQRAAVAWLSKHLGYAEALSDDMSTGDRVDSVGSIDGRTVLIEVKSAINAGMSRHATNRPGTIESKIAGALGAIHRRERDRLSETARSLWDRRQPPIIAILAGSYSNSGLIELLELLDRRSRDWLFDYRVWQWTGQAVNQLAASDSKQTPNPSAYDELKIETLVGRAARQPARSCAELSAIAADNGVGEVFDYALQRAQDLGYRFESTRSGILLQRRTADGRGWQSIIGFYVTASSTESGLNVGCWRELICANEDDLPGTPAPRKGFLNTNRYLRNTEDIQRLFLLFDGIG